jgi:hypothetical protein
MDVKSSVGLRLKGGRRLLFAFLCVWFPLIVFWVNTKLADLEGLSSAKLPFGVFVEPGGNVYLQDFSYNMLYFKGIRERLVAHPYRLVDQEKLIRQMVPGINAGMSHAYSPVAFVLALPLINLSGARAYLIYTVLGAIATLLLFYFYLLPKIDHPLQLYVLSAGALGICLFVAFQLGQSALITTPILGMLWALLQKRNSMAGLPADILLAILFWALCLKPSVALIPFALLIGTGAWRILAISVFLLLATWTFVSGYYGGWLVGLHDYIFLLNHYDNEEFTPFMQRGNDFPLAANLFNWDPHLSTDLFSFDRGLVLIINMALLFLRWSSRINAAEHFQAAIWTFLLFSPYLSGCENWVLCLLVTEGAFFKSSQPLQAIGKFALIFGILVIGGIRWSADISIPCKWLLFLWTAVAIVSAKAKIV